MTEDEFLAQYGTKDTASDPEQEFLKKFKVDQPGLLAQNAKNAAGTGAFLGDLVMGIPKLGAQAAMALTARAYGGVTGNPASLNDTWKAAGDLIDENPNVPNFGKINNLNKTPGYQVPSYPFQKLGEGIDYLGDKSQEALAPHIGNRAAEDVAGQVKLVGNVLGADLGIRGAKYGIRKLGELMPETSSKEAPMIDHTNVEKDFLDKYLANQSDMKGGAGAFDNIRRQTSGEINPSQDITNTPMERVTDSLLNGKDQAAVEGAKSANEHSAVTQYWKDRAEQVQAEEAGMRDANAADVREHLTQPDDLAQRPMAVGSDGTVTSATDADAMARATQGISYENIPPDGVIPRDSPTAGITVPRNVPDRWTVDENGMPVRQGMPIMEHPTEVQNIDVNQPHVNDLGNAIQEANGPKLGPDEIFGSGPMDAPTASPKMNAVIRRPYKNSQRGSIDGDLVHATSDLILRGAKMFADLASKPVKSLIGMLPEDHMSRQIGADMVYKPEAGEKIAARAAAQGPMKTHLWKNVQSGLALAAEKTGSEALKGVGQWLNWSDKRTAIDNKKFVDPVHKSIKTLNDKDFQELTKVLKEEQLSRALKNPTELTSRLSPKGMEAYNKFRQLRDTTFDRTNATNKMLGKAPITKEEAGHASVRQGDWKQPVYDKSGKLLYQFAHQDKLGAIRATNWLKKHLGDKIDWDKSEAYFGPDASHPGIPRDIMGTYQNMMKFFPEDNPVITLIQDSIKKYNEEHAYTNRSFDDRLKDKRLIPGFEGDKPWLSDKQNAKDFMDSQMKYFRDANHWNNLQESLANLEPILKNEQLIKQQPNIMSTAAAHVSRELGINGNILAAIESKWARYFPKVGLDGMKPIAGLGTSRGQVYKGVADVKMGTYMTMLGMNVPYMITTPLQAVMSVAQHRALTLKGFDHNVARTTLNSLADVSAGLSRHFMSSMTGKDVNIPISAFGKRMLQYAEDNGILDKTVLDETGGTRGHLVADAMKKTLGATITAPEKVARWSTFVAFAHHLMDSGKLSEPEAFKMAEDFTNHSLTSMRRADKPLIVDKLGTAGQLGYVFKSYLFNEYNQLSQFARLASKGNVSPLMLHAATLFALGGALALPGVNELDEGYNVFKNLISKLHPQSYSPDLGIKGAILRDLPTWASIGTASQVSRTNIGTRFNTQIVNVSNPLSDVAVPIQEGREILSLGDFAFDPTMRNAMNALHANVGSTAKGFMETHSDLYKNKNKMSSDGRNPDGTMSYIRPSDINSTSTDYKRTPEEESRRALGFYSDEEYKTKQIRYANNKEQERVVSAYNNMMKLAIRAGIDGNTDRAQMFSKRALQLDPDPAKYSKTLNEAVLALGTTPEQRDKMKASRIMELQKVLRATPQ